MNDSANILRLSWEGLHCIPYRKCVVLINNRVRGGGGYLLLINIALFCLIVVDGRGDGGYFVVIF